MQAVAFCSIIFICYETFVNTIIKQKQGKIQALSGQLKIHQAALDNIKQLKRTEANPKEKRRIELVEIEFQDFAQVHLGINHEVPLGEAQILVKHNKHQCETLQKLSIMQQIGQYLFDKNA